MLDLRLVPGLDPEVLADPGTAHVLVEGREVVSRQEVPGLTVQAETLPDGVRARLELAPGVRLAKPVHLCVGVMQHRAVQRIRIAIRLGEGSAADFLAHCFFPNAEDVLHEMEGVVDVGADARMGYVEEHFHGLSGGIRVHPHARIRVGPRARLASDFGLTTGRVGRLDLHYEVEVAEDGLAELKARVFGHGLDRIAIRDEVLLAGARSRATIKTRVAVEDHATCEVTGVTDGAAEGARGHMDCTEIVRGAATARASPIVKVSHPQAKVTHEAAIGTVDRHQMETLMARGLTPDQAVDVIVTGLLGVP